MKRLFPLLLIFLIFTVSCGTKYDILSYQEKSIRANCKINNKYEAVITKDEEHSSLKIISPKELFGTSFHLYKNEAYIEKDELKIPVNKDILKGISALVSCFSLNEAALTTVENQNKSSIVTFNSSNATYIVTYGQNKLPCHFEITGDTFSYSIEVSSIELK
jgi:hypothetical protein